MTEAEDASLCFVGDLFPAGRLLDDDPATVRERVDVPVYWEADYRVANLECPIGTGPPVSKKSTLHAPPDAVDHLDAIGVDVVSLANNHVQDLGVDAIGETVDVLTDAGIATVGAGRTLREAARPCRVTDDLAMLGYCAVDRPSLTKIQVATETDPGVNPLRRDRVAADLDALPDGTRAILCFHWGVENTWFPSAEAVALAESLLADPRVAGIVGAHPHRPQGVLSRGPKRAYYSLGNFLFPSFCLAPPVASTTDCDPEAVEYETRLYHPVTEPSLKTWPAGARTSLAVTYDSGTGRFDHTPLFQDDSLAVRSLTGRRATAVNRWVEWSGALAGRWPGVSDALLSGNRTGYGVYSALGTIRFLYRQNGSRWLADLFGTVARAKMAGDRDVTDRLYEFFEASGRHRKQ
jgi:poly-gamma-glutamate synthesis protein (capsule biosynthesis protein)